jgi:hypothetical protein
MYFAKILKPMVRPQMLSDTLQPEFDINGGGLKRDMEGNKKDEYKKRFVMDKSKIVKITK